MTIVLVHGNPETAAIWGPLVDALGRPDVVRLSPPGFGAPVPAGWAATVGNYRDWLIGELEALGAGASPVDLVGHDWGGGHVTNVAMTRPDLLRTWCTDTIGLFDPDYVTHGAAQAESVVAALAVPDLDSRVAILRAAGVPDDVVAVLAPGLTEVSGAAILELYRSARQPALANLGRNLPQAAKSPGLALLASEDHYVSPASLGRRAAAAAGAAVEVLPGRGHWWMLEDPEGSAALLGRFWESVLG